jgi:hypothetical protein
VSPDTPQERLLALRREGAPTLDPLRWRFIEALAQRLPAQDGAVRELLAARLDAALLAYGQRWAAARPANVPAAGDAPALAPGATPSRTRRKPAPPAPAGGPLAGLQRHIEAARAQRLAQAPAQAERDGPAEMASVSAFRETWSRYHTETQVAQAVVRGPENAGPLNSHMLVVQTLERMDAISPDYLRRFLSHVDTLRWLDAAVAGLPAPRETRGKPKAPRRARRA